jgi:hypothetical protein
MLGPADRCATMHRLLLDSDSIGIFQRLITSWLFVADFQLETVA